MTKIKLLDILIFFLILLNFLIRIPFLNDVAVLDEGGYFQGVMHAYENRLNPFIEFDGYKPPVTTYVPALLFALFSPSRIWARLFIAICSSGALLFTYLLGAHLYSKRVGFSAAILLFFLPVFMAQSFLYSDALPVTVLALTTYYSYFKRNWVWYGISATLLVLTKETTPLLLFLLAAYEWYVTRKTLSFPRHILRTVLLLLPIQALIIWMLLNKLYLGWYVWPASYNVMITGTRSIFLLKANMEAVFFSVATLPIFILSVIGISIYAIQHKDKRFIHIEYMVLFVLLFFFSLMIISLRSDGILLRYALYAFPFLFLVLVYLADCVFSAYKKLKIALLICLCLWFVGSHVYMLYTGKVLNPNEDLSLFQFRNQHRAVMSYVLEQYPRAAFINVWPYNRFFEEPINGYVEYPRILILLSDVVFRNTQMVSNLDRTGYKDMICIVFMGETYKFCEMQPALLLVGELRYHNAPLWLPADKIYRWVVQ